MEAVVRVCRLALMKKGLKQEKKVVRGCIFVCRLALMKKGLKRLLNHH